MTMSQADKQLLAALTSFSKEQIKQAGQRYTPGIDPQAPNLRLESLFTAIENVACGARALARFHSILTTFSEAWDRTKHCSQRRDALQMLADDARVGNLGDAQKAPIKTGKE